MDFALENNITNNIEEEQNNFLNSGLWNAINNGINIGLRVLLPDIAEDAVICLKDNLINYGLKDGISKSIQSVIDTGKSAVGIITGKFENVNQINTAVKSGGIIDSVSDILDNVLDKVENTTNIDDGVISLIKNGKDAILTNIEKNIDSTLTSQITSAENLQSYMDKWKDAYSQQDFSTMEKEFSKITKELSNLVPIENTLVSARNIEILHNLIKNNNQNFNLTEEERELVNKLSM